MTEAEPRGWHRTPSCAWMKVDPEGEARCIYESLGSSAAALEMARFTFLGQGYIDEKAKELRENYSGPLAKACAPETCVRLLPRLADAVHA